MSADSIERVDFCKNTSSTITIGGVDLPCFIEADVTATLKTWEPQNMGGRREDAVPGEQEATLHSVEMEVTVANKDDTQFVTFKSTDTTFYEEFFGEVDVTDLP